MAKIYQGPTFGADPHLNLIARAAGESGEAGPYVVEKGNAVRLRDWLCDALSPMARRDPRRIALTERVRVELEGQEGLPKNSKAAADAVDLAVRLRVRASGRCNVSRVYPNWFVPVWSVGTIKVGA